MTFQHIRAAVVGIGFVGQAHVDALRRIGVDVAAVVGSSPDRAGVTASAHGLPPVAPSLEAVLADDSIDAIHIATPNHLHAEQVHAALDADKHVICEKPLGLDATETAGLVERAAASERLTAACFNLRFYPINHDMAAKVRTGVIGAPRLVTGAFLQDWLLQESDWNWRLDPKIGGRLQSLADIGSHWLDLARFVTGQDVVEVMAELHTFVAKRERPETAVATFGEASDPSTTAVTAGGDDAATVLLRFAGGARGAMHVSQVAAGRKNSFSLEIHGATDSLAWTSQSPDELWVGHRDRPNEHIQRDPLTMAAPAAAVSTYPVGHVEGYGDTFRGLFSRVYTHIAAGGPPPEPDYPTFADGHDAVLVTEAIARSHASGTWTTVERSTP